MSKLKAKVYIPTHRLHEGEQYDSFSELIGARPDCKTDMDSEENQIPYKCVYAEEQVIV